MTLNDLHAAQIESIYSILLALGAYTFCLCMTRYICAKMIVEAIVKQKVVVEVPVYSQNAVPYGQVYFGRIGGLNGSIPSQFPRQTECGLSQSIPFVCPS